MVAGQDAQRSLPLARRALDREPPECHCVRGWCPREVSCNQCRKDSQLQDVLNVYIMIVYWFG